MKINFKITAVLLRAIHADLERAHQFAAERVGFVTCRVAALKNEITVLAENYHPVADHDYLDDASVGAMMGPAAIRKVLQLAYRQRISIFHVHEHPHNGRPWFSQLDLQENAKFVPDFWNVRPEFPHGALVLSSDSGAGLCWVPGKQQPLRITKFVIVGAPMKFVWGEL